ncbi:MAG: signal peptide peptidase SppA [Pirellulales bacterium]|nr:signal peptide peptidase SppA [Pirellulales bacterium]
MENQPYPPSQPPMNPPPPGYGPPLAQPPRRRSVFARVLIGALVVSLLMMLGFSMLVGMVALSTGGLGSERRVKEKFFSHNRDGQDKVAIITLNGVILEGDGFIKRQIDHALEDENLKAVVLRVDSPGGTVSGSDYILHHLRNLVAERKIPLVVSMGSMAASGGYYVSMAVGDTPNSIFAEPTTWTGSIGVKIPRYDLSKLLKTWGVEEDTIASGPYKTMGSLAKPLSPEEKKIFQSLVDDMFGRFKMIIREGRPKFEKDPEALDKLATGQIFDAPQALESGLIDKIGFVEDAVDRAIELAQLDPETVRVVQYKPEPTLASVLFEGESRSPQLDPAALLEMASPKAYYLSTWLPSALPAKQ